MNHLHHKPLVFVLLIVGMFSCHQDDSYGIPTTLGTEENIKLNDNELNTSDNENEIVFYSKSIEKLNKYINYHFSLLQQKDLKNLDIIIGFLPGTKISIENIILDVGEKIKIEQKDIIFFSKKQ